MHDIKLSSAELVLIYNTFSSKGVSFTGDMAPVVTDIQKKLRPTIDTLIEEAKKTEAPTE